jgi:ADP-ribose pyrophosphatase YjhB (NUDIX family)
MITFETPQGRFNYRVAGVAIIDGHVPLHQAAGDDFWTLPGGRPEAMETARDALCREMLEETALTVSVSRLLWIVENFFTYGGKPFHELLFGFEMTVPDSVDPQTEFRGIEGFRGTGRTTELTFRWYSLDRLHTVRIEPVFLREALRELPQSITHIVQRG